MADYPLHRTMMNSSTSIEFDSEPQLKRARLHFEVNETCIEKNVDLHKNESINTGKDKSNNSEVDLNGGDSGFQDFVSSESLSNSCPSFSNNTETSGISFFHPNESKSLPEVADFTDSLDGVLDECSKNLTDIAPCCSKSLPSNSNEEDNEEDDQLSVISDISCLSSLSDLEDAEKWQSNFGPLNWVQQQITSGTNPREIINEILPNNSISSQVGNLTLWKFIVNILSEPPKRTKLPNVNLLSDVVSLIERSKKILVLTGAGISVSSGIPDFRSRDGIYARLSVDFPDLPDPQAMFDINYFRKDQRPFFKFAKELYPGQFQPSICHRFIRQIEKNGKLLRNYTQNIDTLEKSAGIERVITCHGSFATASCTNCKHRVDCLEIKEDIFAQRIPKCQKCASLFDQQESNTFDLQENLANISDESITCDSQSQSQESKMCVMKPDIVFFGEGLPDEFHNSVSIDKSDCDLLIVIGSSLKVKPVALIPTSIPSEIPQILINREPLPHMTFDVELLGDCDVIVQELCNRLGEGWNNICVNEKLTETVEHSDFNDFVVNHEDLQHRYLFFPPNHYVFKGAELQGWKDSDSSDDEDI